MPKPLDPKARLILTLEDLAAEHGLPKLRTIAADVRAIPGDLEERYVEAVMTLAASAFAPTPRRS